VLDELKVEKHPVKTFIVNFPLWQKSYAANFDCKWGCQADRRWLYSLRKAL